MAMEILHHNPGSTLVFLSIPLLIDIYVTANVYDKWC